MGECDGEVLDASLVGQQRQVRRMGGCTVSANSTVSSSPKEFSSFS